jgi:hypothetical protein
LFLVAIVPSLEQTSLDIATIFAPNSTHPIRAAIRVDVETYVAAVRKQVEVWVVAGR